MLHICSAVGYKLDEVSASKEEQSNVLAQLCYLEAILGVEPLLHEQEDLGHRVAPVVVAALH